MPGECGCKKGVRPTLKKGSLKSVHKPKELPENVLRTLSMKGVPVRIHPPGAQEDENDLEKKLVLSMKDLPV